MKQTVVHDMGGVMITGGPQVPTVTAKIQGTKAAAMQAKIDALKKELDSMEFM